mmetsp:Transcript_22745/g.17175  ORF Transcript_22745/g.17175 Transcript_22745/m.17175 type:complete len:100 (+) Transcript_22745:1498-1797(+)
MKLIDKNYYLNCAARDAYKSYMQSYASHKLREIFDVNKLDLQKLAYSFGLQVPPRVNLNVKVSGQKVRRQKLQDQLGMKRGLKGAMYSQGAKMHGDEKR